MLQNAHLQRWNESVVLNKSFDWMIQYLTEWFNDWITCSKRQLLCEWLKTNLQRQSLVSFLNELVFWTNHLTEWFNDSLIETTTLVPEWIVWVNDSKTNLERQSLDSFLN